MLFQLDFMQFFRLKRGKKVKKKIHSTLKRDLEARAKSEHYRLVLPNFFSICFSTHIVLLLSAFIHLISIL